MKYKINPIKMFIWTTLVALLLSEAYAQSDNVTVNLSAVTLSSRVSDLKFENSSRIDHLNIPKRLRSERIQYSGPPTLYFFEEDETVKDESGKPIRKILGVVNIPSKQGYFLLIFSDAPAGSKFPYRIAILPDDLSSFKRGMYRFINTAPFDIAVKFGETEQIIRKKSFMDVDPNGQNKTYVPAIFFSLVDGQEPIRSYKGAFYYSENSRVIQVIGASPYGTPGRIEMKSISERLPGEEE